MNGCSIVSINNRIGAANIALGLNPPPLIIFEVVFIFEVIFIFEVVLIVEVVFIFVVIFIFEVVFIFRGCLHF